VALSPLPARGVRRAERFRDAMATGATRVRLSRLQLSIGLFAVQYAGDFKVVPLVAEKHPVILSAEPDQRRGNPL